MIDFISTWTQGIIIAVIIATIIEMVVPNGSSKKYIKVVIGIYVLFNIVAPVINRVSSGKIDVSKFIDSDEYNVKMDSNSKMAQNITNDNTSNIKELYIKNLEKDIKEKIKDKGYVVSSIQIEVENGNDYKVRNITLKLCKANKEEMVDTSNIIDVKEVEIVNITVGRKENVIKDESTNLTDNEKKEIKEYLSSIYNVEANNISIN